MGAPACNLLVAAASDLSPFQDDLKVRLGSVSKCDVRFTFGSSGQLSQQIANGAPYDLFLSASADYLKTLKTLDRRVYAQGRLALWSKAGLRWPDLATDKVRRIAIANPKLAPYGKAAREALESQGLWPKVESKVVYAESVRQAFQFAETGNADVALVAYPLVVGKSGIPVDPGWYKPMEQTAALLTHSPAARLAFDFLTGPEGRALFRSHGLN